MSIKCLVFSELGHHRPKNVTLEILSRLQGRNPDVVIFDSIDQEGIDSLKKHGAQNIYLVKNETLKSYSAEGYANALSHVVATNKYTHVFGGASAVGKDFFPRVSGHFKTGMVSEVIDFRFEGDQFTGTRPLFAGKCLADVKVQGDYPHFITVRPNALGINEVAASGNGTVKELPVESCEIKAKLQNVIKGTSERADLTEANIIVSGGRAMKNSENFAILEKLANVLGATVGASRAAVDSGYALPSMQVGQTGKTVSPNLYIACGISGAIQHLAGMRTSKYIIAINTDPEAPIFSKADYGIVGDLFKIVPLLTDELKKFLEK